MSLRLIDLDKMIIADGRMRNCGTGPLSLDEESTILGF